MSRKKSNQSNPKVRYADFARRFNEVLPYSGVEIAQKTEVTPAAVSTWRKGFQLPEGKNLLAILNGFDVSCDYLLSGRGFTKPADSNENNIRIFSEFLERVSILLKLMQTDPRADLIPVLDGILGVYIDKLPPTDELKQFKRLVQRKKLRK